MVFISLEKKKCHIRSKRINSNFKNSSSNTMLAAPPEMLIHDFVHEDYSIVMSADSICWPDSENANGFDMLIGEEGNQYLNASSKFN